MTATIPQFLNLPDGRKIAYLTNSKSKPQKSGLLWCGGFKSDMAGTKASCLSDWATKNNLSCTRFDYSGHGASSGKFEDGTIGDWAEEATSIFDKITTGPQILIGSSMGAWIALLLAQHHIKQMGAANSRITAIVLIAPAVDMTEDLMWDKFPAEIREEIFKNGAFMRPSAYGDGSYAITLKLIEEGRNHLLFGGEKIEPHCPVRILHGLQDVDVPWQHSEKLLAHLDSNDVQLDLIEDGDHRLSRDQDIKQLLMMIGELLGEPY